jgi:hypothetical protein
MPVPRTESCSTGSKLNGHRDYAARKLCSNTCTRFSHASREFEPWYKWGSILMSPVIGATARSNPLFLSDENVMASLPFFAGNNAW